MISINCHDVHREKIPTHYGHRFPKNTVMFYFNETTDSPFPKRQILDSSKFKKFAVDNFEFDENGRKFSKWVEDTVGKGQIACYEQFLLFPWCFQNTCRHVKTRACLGNG